MTLKREFFDEKYFSKRYLFFKPNERLTDKIDFFWEMTPTDSQYIPEEVNEKIFANASSSLIFNLGSPFYLYGDKGNLNILNKSAIIGCRTLPALYKHLKGNSLFGIKFKPGAWSVFFDINPSEMENDFILFDEFNRDKSVTEQIASASTIYEKINAAQNYLLKYRNDKYDYKYNAVRNTINAFLSDLLLNRKLSGISKELNMIPKTLFRYFRETVGLNPKTCLNILRLRTALKHFAADKPSFSIYDYGYFDYSHFIKEIKKYTHNSPSELSFTSL